MFRRYRICFILTGITALLYFVYYAYVHRTTGRRTFEDVNLINFLDDYKHGDRRESVVTGKDVAVLVWENEWKKDDQFCTVNFKFYAKLFTSPAGSFYIYKTSEKFEFGVEKDALFRTFNERLLSDANYGFIEIGDRFGEYALLAAKYGREVTLISSSQISVVEFCETARKNDVLDKILLFYAGKPSSKKIEEISLKGDYSLFVSQTVRFDDVLPYVKSNKVIVKIDADGFEFDLLHVSAEVMNTIDVSVIIMKWDAIKATPKAVSLIELLLGNRMKAFTVYASDNVGSEQKELALEQYKQWPAYIQWIKESE